MASNHHTDPMFAEKRKPKNPIKFQLQLNEEQKETKAKILENDITIITGQAGSGKTLVAGIAKYSAKQPGRFTPTPTVLRQRWTFPARQFRHKPQVICPSPDTL